MEPFHTEYFATNRRRLLELLPEQSAVLLLSASLRTRSWDSHYPFCQDRNFYYLTGYPYRDAALLLKKGQSTQSAIMFVAELTPLQIHWNGYLPGPVEAKKMTGIETVLPISSLNRQLTTALNSAEHLFMDFQPQLPDEPLSSIVQYAEQIRHANPHIMIRRVHPLMARLREVKNGPEIDRIRKAVDLTHHAINRVLRYLRPGIAEYELEAHFNFDLHQNRSNPAFQTIIAAGQNATILHYANLDSRVNDDDLVLMDLGAECQLYSADISRTFPANGRFSTEQRRLYSIVLEANKRVIQAVKPGVSLSSLNDLTKEILSAGMKEMGYLTSDSEISKYYTHGVSHSLGLDTHDIVSGFYQTIIPGMVITVEPGLYIPEINTGIRIEDDVLVTESGCVNLSCQIPKEPDEIEQWMVSARS